MDKELLEKCPGCGLLIVTRNLRYDQTGVAWHAKCLMEAEAVSAADTALLNAFAMAILTGRVMKGNITRAEALADEVFDLAEAMVKRSKRSSS